MAPLKSSRATGKKWEGVFMTNFPHDGGSHDEIRPASLEIDDRGLIAALETMPDGVAVFDENHRLVFANKSYREFLGERADGIHAGMAMADVVGGLSDNGRIMKVEVTHTGGMDATEWMLSDGRVIRFISRSLPRGGRMCVGTDVTNAAAERSAHRMIDLSVSRPEPRPDLADWRALGAAADSLDVGIVLLNATGEPELFNENYQSFLGLLERSRQPVETVDLTTTKPVAHSVRRWRGEANDNGPDETHHALPGDKHIQEGLTVDGRTIRYALRPLSQGNLLCVGVDVTAKKDMEREIARLRAEIESVREAKAVFLSSIIDEIRAPLNAIIEYTQTMLNDTREPPTARQRENIDIVFRSAGYLLDLCCRVLDFQAIETGRIDIERVPMSAVDVVQECLDILAFQARARGVNMSGETVGGETAAILADPIRFRQVMANLLSNAVKYNRPGGHVWVTCSLDRRGWCRIAVKDTGHGIPLHRRGDVFKPFNRQEPESGQVMGAGIGLAISKYLIERMGGRIGFESEPGRGSTFWVEMPSAADWSASPPSNGGPTKKEHMTAA
jgi:signal transduction histidine kinase